jgi:hypothetical protein
MHSISPATRSHGKRRTGRHRSPYRPIVIPGLRRVHWPPWWQLLGCAVVLAGSAAALAWVFSGGLAEAPHREVGAP